MKRYRLFCLFMTVLALLGLAACSNTDILPEQTVTPSVGSSGFSLSCNSDAECRSKALGIPTFYFERNVAEFRAEYREILTYHAWDLAANPGKRVRLEGHADDPGTREYNVALGKHRAEGIQKFLVANGASPSQIKVISYGKERPAVRGTSYRAYQRNRRVNLVVLSRR